MPLPELKGEKAKKSALFAPIFTRVVFTDRLWFNFRVTTSLLKYSAIFVMESDRKNDSQTFGFACFCFYLCIN